MHEPSEKILLTAAWIAPMDGPPVRDAGVVYADGMICAVGSISRLRHEHPEATVHDLGNAVILPGLINAHTHLELSDVRQIDPPPARFVDWIMTLMGLTAKLGMSRPDVVRRAVLHGADQCLRFGVTRVGDISRQCTFSRAALNETRLKAVSFGEVQAMGLRRDLLEERLAAAIDQTHASDRVTIGLTPHAPYSIERAGYERCVHAAREHHLPLATHLAETPDESPFLAGHSGAFAELWSFLNAWDEDVLKFPGGPIRFAESVGLLDYPTLLAHVNYCDDAELAILSKGHASVVYCPRTHAYFGHPPHRWREMLRSGINVAIGTDSCASSPDLNLVDDLRLVHKISPETEPFELWKMATTRAATALGCTEQGGSLTAGKAADMVAFSVKSSDPLLEILLRNEMPAKVWIDGQ